MFLTHNTVPASRNFRKTVLAVSLAFLIAMMSGTALAGEWTSSVYPATPGTRHAPALRYWVYTPDDLKPGLPLVVYLHSSDGVKFTAMKDILPVFIDDGTIAHPQAIVLVPQLTRDLRLFWSDAIVSVDAVVKSVMEEYEVDTSRISLTGASLGGNGVWTLASLSPGRYARLLSIGGWVDAGITADSFAQFEEIKVFSAKDKPNNRKSSEKFVDSLKSIGANASWESLNLEHMDAPRMLYADTDIQKWLWLIPEEDPEAEEEAVPEAAEEISEEADPGSTDPQ